jgi:hypothetical protein
MERIAVRRILAEDGDYRIWHEYEHATLEWPGGALPIGDHYGDPTCALISSAGGWCLTAGEGLIVCLFDGGLPRGSASPADASLRTRELWRRRNPPPNAACWFVHSVAHVGETIHVTTDPLSDYAGVYEVDVRTMTWRRM